MTCPPFRRVNSIAGAPFTAGGPPRSTTSGSNDQGTIVASNNPNRVPGTVIASGISFLIDINPRRREHQPEQYRVADKLPVNDGDRRHNPHVANLALNEPQVPRLPPVQNRQRDPGGSIRQASAATSIPRHARPIRAAARTNRIWARDPASRVPPRHSAHSPTAKSAASSKQTCTPPSSQSNQDTRRPER